ncbi:MAG: NAD(P)-dependent oxidoreductase [Microcella sp.]|uniref:NAD-dependent epimerase/dehydratase family protein n=1 Tax=Microcella sp. TaxID=1913979 RepID=UPI0024C6783C|nr:NAD(P)-dependent oxidoreductase [Microcella sp.]UYN83181.1 MAG: NAD(P)-dependent oxidoreductase [Microcella sp.]
MSPRSSSAQRVLVTGGAGRLGRSVVRVLHDAGHDVISVDRVHDEGSPGEQYVADLSDAAATADLVGRIRPEIIVHLAAIAVPFSAPDAAMYATNTGLFFSVRDAALTAGVARLLVASSPTVLGYGAPQGWSPHYLPLDEAHPRAPWNGYAMSKAATEDLVSMTARQHPASLTIGAFRPCFVVAPEEWHGAVTQQGHTIAERLDDPSLSVTALFNYIDARDAGEFVHAWITAPADVVNGQTYIVGAGDSLVREPLGDVLARVRPEWSELASHLAPTASLFSSDRARADTGWRARRSWRTEFAADASATTHSASR